jgi:CheY-like chemotaxis protein
MRNTGDARNSKTGTEQTAPRSVRPNGDSGTARAGLVVLLVDDDRAALTVMAATLWRLGVRTFLAGDGAKALQILENELSVDVVVTDVAMPHVDGLELLRRIKQSAIHKDLPVILCSGHADPETMKKASEDGCALYLLKPVEPEFLFEEISTILQRGA